MRSRLHGGLQRGSTCLDANGQHYGKLQGLQARAARNGWREGDECTDAGHIDWLLASTAAVRAHGVGVATEELCPPLPPQSPNLFGQDRLPPGGKIFPSDHYPVWADVTLLHG